MLLLQLVIELIQKKLLILEFGQQITDIFVECCIDYDKDSEITKRFYAMIQNKYHYAITGNTAAENIHRKAEHTKENMGLTT